MLDSCRAFASNHDPARRVAGRTLKDLDLPGQHGAVVTRVRRGDVEFLPTGSTVVQLGVRLRVLSSSGSLGEVLIAQALAALL